MDARGHKRLTKEEVRALLARLEEREKRPECWCCECLQGFIAQLESDAEDDARPLLAPYKRAPADVQRCQSCEHCVPAEIFAEYLVRRREENT